MKVVLFLQETLGNSEYKWENLDWPPHDVYRKMDAELFEAT